MIKDSLLNYGLSSNLNGTEDDQIKVTGIEDYRMPSTEREFTLLEDDEESGSESEFTEVDTDYSNYLTGSDSELESDLMYNYLYVYIWSDSVSKSDIFLKKILLFIKM